MRSELKTTCSISLFCIPKSLLPLPYYIEDAFLCSWRLPTGGLYDKQGGSHRWSRNNRNQASPSMSKSHSFFNQDFYCPWPGEKWTLLTNFSDVPSLTMDVLVAPFDMSIYANWPGTNEGPGPWTSRTTEAAGRQLVVPVVCACRLLGVVCRSTKIWRSRVLKQTAPRIRT